MTPDFEKIAGDLHDEVHEAAALVDASNCAVVGWAPEDSIPILQRALQEMYELGGGRPSRRHLLSAELRDIAIELTRRVVSRAIRLSCTRNDLESTHGSDGEPLFEDEMVDDAVAVALGEDTGCLGDEDINAANIDVLYVEAVLTQIQRGTFQSLKRLKRPEWDESVIQALGDHRDASDIYLVDCPACAWASYYNNQGSHATCRNCGRDLTAHIGEAYTLADFWDDAPYPCDEKGGAK